VEHHEEETLGSADQEQQTSRQSREAAGMAKEDLGRRLSRLESFCMFRGDRGRREADTVNPSYLSEPESLKQSKTQTSYSFAR
jgi:hypothetical protein